MSDTINLNNAFNNVKKYLSMVISEMRNKRSLMSLTPEKLTECQIRDEYPQLIYDLQEEGAKLLQNHIVEEVGLKYRSLAEQYEYFEDTDSFGVKVIVSGHQFRCMINEYNKTKLKEK